MGLINPAARNFAFRGKPEAPLHKWHIYKGDLVEVIAGRYKSTQGKVLAVNHKENSVTVAGANLKFKKVEDEEMQRRKKTVWKEVPLHVSNVALVDPTTNQATKIKYGFLEDGTKVRLSKKSGTIIPIPDRSHLQYLNRNKTKELGIYDTRGDLVLEKTYTGEDFVKVKAEFEAYLRIKEDKERLMVFKN
jgi:large subunit ribosomal protein L24